MCGLGSITLESGVTMSPALLGKGIDELLRQLDHRGGHACGLVCIDEAGKSLVQKAPVKAAEFIKDRMNAPVATRAVMVHTRMATKGPKEWNRNNHPVAGTNGALVMHNGVVHDSHLTRVQGDPLVDTYALALAAGAVAKRKPRELATTFAKRVVAACMDIDGSQALQITYRDKPVVISARVRSNPLFEALVDGVRVTASTSTAVEKTLVAMGLKVPEVEHTYTSTIKGGGKRGKDRVETRTSMRPEIFMCQEGQILLWDAGKHEYCAVEVVEPTIKRSVQSYAGSGSYAAGNNTYHTYGTPGTGRFVPHTFKQGDRVKVTRPGVDQGRIGWITSVNNNGAPVLYTLNLIPHEGKISKTQTGVKEHEIELQPVVVAGASKAQGKPATPAGAQQIPGVHSVAENTTPAIFLVGDRVKHKALLREGVVLSSLVGNGGVRLYTVFFPTDFVEKQERKKALDIEVTMGASGLEFVKGGASQADLDAILNAADKAFEKGSMDFEECEVCNTISERWEEIEGVLLCSECASKSVEWDNAGIPRD